MHTRPRFGWHLKLQKTSLHRPTRDPNYQKHFTHRIFSTQSISLIKRKRVLFSVYISYCCCPDTAPMCRARLLPILGAQVFSLCYSVVLIFSPSDPGDLPRREADFSEGCNGYKTRLGCYHYGPMPTYVAPDASFTGPIVIRSGAP